MKKVCQKQLTNHINLVKWQEKKQLQKLNLLTIHSLLLNSNPKFIELKQIIQNFNSNIDKGVERKHLQYEFTLKLYEMLRHMILIPNYQNMLKFLNRVYEWTKQGGRGEIQFEDTISYGGKSRPNTASTRTRPFSAYSRPKSGVPKMNLIKLQDPTSMKITNKEKTNVDYDKLQPGDIEFYNGTRTLHPEQQVPKKKLKQYQRKIFYDQQVDEDLEVVDLNKEHKQFSYYKPPIMKVDETQLPVQENQLNLDENGEIINGAEGQENQGLGQDQGVGDLQEDVNVDDLPLEGEVQQEEQEVIDKLKPRLKAFIKHQTQLSKNKVEYARGIKQVVQDRNKLARKKLQDQFFQQKMVEWAKQKSRTKREQKRRAQSARIVTKKVGIGYKQAPKLEQNVNIINFESIPVHQTKQSRPKTAFRSINLSNRQQLIKNCFITGKMNTHITKYESINFDQNEQNRFMRITSLAQKPKKKTFQQILQQAQSKVKNQEMYQIQHVKQKFAKNKVQFETNRIAKSVTYHAGGTVYEDEDAFAGQITGMNMLKNPFFKVGKKKKKKNKKK